MSNCPNADNLLLGAGAIYFERLNGANSYEASRHLGNCSSFSINTEVIRNPIPRLHTTVTDLKQLQIVGFNVTGTITLDEISRENIALVVAGSIDNTFVQIASSAVTQEYTVRKGTLIYLGYTDQVDKVRKYGVTIQEVTCAGSACDTSYYQVNNRAGTIYIPHTSPLAENSKIYVTYSCPSVNIPQISIANNTYVSGKLTFIGDPTTGPAYLCEIKKVELSFEGLSLIEENLSQLKANFIVTAHDTNICQFTEGYYNLIELPNV